MELQIDSPKFINNEKLPFLSPCASVKRRISTDSNSPEFEFWMVRNPSMLDTNLLSADELFVDGVILPLHLVDTRVNPLIPDPDPEIPTQPEPDTPDQIPEPEPGPRITSDSTVLSVSKRWKDIFKSSKPTKKEEEKTESKEKEKDKKKRVKEKKGGRNGPGGAELNIINIWPFSRSRSAGNETRPRWIPGSSTPRKVSSAPCSRSNSAGESKSKKWPSSPSRGGVHLGRSSPVWQVRRGNSGPKITETGLKNGGETRRVNGGGTTSNAKTKVLNLNVPVPACIGYRSNLSCRSDPKSATAVGRSGRWKNGGQYGGVDGGDANNIGSGANIFNLRSIFTKKVY